MRSHRSRHQAALVAVADAPVDELGLHRLHEVALLLAHRLAQLVGLGHREAREVGRDAHDLLLVDHDPVGVAEDRLEVRVVVGDLLEAVLAVREGEVHVHRQRPRAVQRQQGRDVLEAGRLELAHQRLHAGRVELEHAQRVAGRQHLVGGRVVHVAEEGRVVEVDLDPAVVGDVAFGVGDDGEVAQPEEVHLQQADGLARPHLVLGDDLAVVGAQQRDGLGQRLGADDDRGGVDAVLALQALEGLGGLEHVAVGRVLAGVAQLGGLGRRPPTAAAPCPAPAGASSWPACRPTAKGSSSTRAASRIADLALIVPKVMIWATRSSPYVSAA